MDRLFPAFALALLLLGGCAQEVPEGPATPLPLPEAPEGPAAPEGPEEPAAPEALPESIPADADVIFSSIRYVLGDPDCREGGEVKESFIQDEACNRHIYAPDGQLASMRQLYAMDLETGEAVRLTGIRCMFFSAQAVDSDTLVASAACGDDNEDGMVNDRDQPQLYLLGLGGGEMECLTCDYGLMSVNNQDYSHQSRKVVFSARTGPDDINHLYTVGLDGSLEQLTDDGLYWDFDCSWSEDGSRIAFSRLPNQTFPWTIPAQVWVMDANGSGLELVTEGGGDPYAEGFHGVYPIGIDADPDLSPDNSRIAFSRLRSGLQNWPFGVYELRVVELESGEMEVLDSQYANMLPEWDEGGIVFIRQRGTSQEEPDPMDMAQGMCLYRGGETEWVEEYPYNVFPVGAYSANWIEYG